MTVVAIVLGILLINAVFVIYLLLRAHKKVVDHFMEMMALEEEIDFMHGREEIPEEKIARKFVDVTLLCNVEKVNSLNQIEKIVDVSNYHKNKVIALTYFVQPHVFHELQASIGEAAESATENLITPIPNCTVIQLKNGQWVWRQESF